MEITARDESKFDRIGEAIMHPHRRKVLLTLYEADDQPVVVSRGDQEDNLALKHNHLPKLETLGFIFWNEETGEITRGPDWGDIEPALDMIESVDGLRGAL